MPLSNRLSQAEQLERFQQLERAVRHCSCGKKQLAAQELQLNEYIDIGLDLAKKASLANRVQLQESWLKRVYNTLFETTLDLIEPEYWRDLCRDYLYQPLFALKYLYRNHPQGKYKIKRLYQELSVTNHYLF